MIHVEFKDFDEMLGFARRLLGQAGEQETVGTVNESGGQPLQPVKSVAPVMTAPISPTPVAQAASSQPAQIPVAPVTSVPAAVPTASQTYTADDLARAAMALMDSGQQPALIGLLGQFGVTSLPELKPEQFGAFATALRGMGAPI